LYDMRAPHFYLWLFLIHTHSVEYEYEVMTMKKNHEGKWLVVAWAYE